MAWTLQQLLAKREALQSGIWAGGLRVQYEGRAVEYRSVAEMERALASLDREIEKAGGANVPRQIVITPTGV